MSDAHPYPSCYLHGTRLVDGCPALCPLIGADTTVEQLRDKAWALVGDQKPEGSRELERAKMCAECCGRLGGHPHVKVLRREFR